MTAIKLYPTLLRGDAHMPPSKSLAHRMIICAALADGESRVRPIQASEDILATLEGMRALGAECVLSGDTAFIRGIGAKRLSAPANIDCRESGSTLRFLFPLSLTLGVGACFTGAAGLAARPLSVYRDLCGRVGIRYSHEALPELRAEVSGRLTPGRYEVPGNVSSQFVTGLLLALSTLEGDSELLLTSPLESAAYVDMTLDAMSAFGVSVKREANGWRVPGGHRYLPRDAVVEGDYSQAANFLCAAALGSELSVSGLNPKSCQGDRAILDALRRMGASVRYADGAFRASPAPLHAIEIDVSNMPDAAPILALTCALSEGESRITGARRLRIKECDRLSATVEAINILGGHAEAGADEIRVTGVPRFRGGCLCDCPNDHRMAMLYAVAATRCEAPITLTRPDCVKKSYPEFWRDYAALGGRIEPVTEESAYV